MFLAVFYLVAVCFVAVSLRWLFGIIQGYRWIKQETAHIPRADPAHAPIVVLIPVLLEVGRIEKTVEYFIATFTDHIRLNIVLITSEKEFTVQSAGPNTVDVCAELARRHEGIVAHYHYPNTDGVMSHQLNYALREMKNALAPEQLICVYNADSRPHPLTFDWVLRKRSKDPTRDVFQQYGDYTKNMDERMGGVLLSAALWQNRWAVGFELWKAITSLRGPGFSNFGRPLNYLIGHGLFITKALYDATVGFSEVFHNEDALLGLEISFLGKLITPLPFFDVSDTPDTIASLFRQKIHWFFGPYQAWGYFVHLKKKYARRSFGEKCALFFLSGKLFLHAVYWVFGPLFVTFLLVSPLMRHDVALFVLGYGVFLFFFAVPNMLALCLRRGGGGPVRLIGIFFSLASAGIITYILHGLSALVAVVLSIHRLLTGRSITKGKTLMKHS